MNNFVYTPGGREIRQFNIETEVRVALQQWKYGTLAALVLAFLLQFFAVKPALELLCAAIPAGVTVSERAIVGVAVFVVALVLAILAQYVLMRWITSSARLVFAGEAVDNAEKALAGVLLVVAVVIASAAQQRLTATMAAREVTAAQLVTAAAKTAASVLLFLALFLPALAAFVNFILNLYDSNMPAPRQPQPAADGPNAPGWVRWLSGWRDRHQPLQAQEEIYTGRSAPVEAPQEVVVTADLLLGTKGHAQKVQIALPLDEWRKLQRYVAKGGRSVSEADLIKAGFSSGPNGRARAIGKAFTAYEGATEKGDKGKPMLVDKLAQWIMARGYARGLDLPL